jgi:hypothetical protein
VSDVTWIITSARKETYKIDPYGTEREAIIVNGRWRRETDFTPFDEEWYADFRGETFDAYVFDNHLRRFVVTMWGSDGEFGAQDQESFVATRRTS